jgi:hypothetical protein
LTRARRGLYSAPRMLGPGWVESPETFGLLEP